MIHITRIKRDSDCNRNERNNSDKKLVGGGGGGRDLKKIIICNTFWVIYRESGGGRGEIKLSLRKQQRKTTTGNG